MIDLQVGWNHAMSHPIEFDGGVLIFLDFIIFLAVLGEVGDLASDVGDDVAVPASLAGHRCDNPDLRRKAVLARDEPSSSGLV